MSSPICRGVGRRLNLLRMVPRLKRWQHGFSRIPSNQAPLPLCLIGTPFQIKVWRALLEIPDGHLATYGAVAKLAGQPKAARAVGAAIGRNPISWLIPCHRAILSNGYVRNYEWGIPRKLAMIGWEAAQRDAVHQQNAAA